MPAAASASKSCISPPLKGRPSADALKELERCANAQFDGSIVEIFVQTMRQLPNPIIEVAAVAPTPHS